MKLQFDINGTTLDAEFSVSDNQAQLRLADQTHEAFVSQPEPGLFVLHLNQRVYRCTVERSPSGATEIVVNGQRIPVAVYDKKRLRGNAAAGAGSGGRVTLTAPMPGKIVRVLLAAGAEVAAQQGVLIVEAMKMQNEVQSPRAGQVVEIRVSEGQTVNAGEVLAVIE
ncbi:MAG: biotin/lipoyl-containing protein [Acidobacteriota bacterium]